MKLHTKSQSSALVRQPRACSLPRTTHHSTRPHTSTRIYNVAQQDSASTTDASSPHTNAPSWPSAPARQAAYSSCELEQATSIPAEVSGTIPSWLQGYFMRNGPGIYTIRNPVTGTDIDMSHMFDGLALLVKMDINGSSNTVLGSHRFVESDAYKHYKQTGTIKWREFGTAVPGNGTLFTLKEMATTILGAMGLMDGVTDNASVNVVPVYTTAGRKKNEVWAVTETVRGTLSINPDTLETTGHVQYQDSLKGDLTTAHPTVLENGDIINLLSTVGVGFQVYRQPPSTSSNHTNKRELIATIPHRRMTSPAWIHDFPCTSTHAVIPDTPLYFNLGALMMGQDTDHVFMDWAPEDEAFMHVVRLTDGVVKSIKIPAFFAFHWANAFESADGRYLHIDGAIYKDPTILSDLYLDQLRAGPDSGRSLSPSSLRRLTIDLETATIIGDGWAPLVKDEQALGNWAEFPRVSPVVKRNQYQYVWMTCATRPTNAGNSLAKVHTVSGSAQIWTQPGGLVGEPTFIPRPGGVDEDDGVVIVMVTEADGRASLLFIDGKEHTEVARARLPYSLPNGFHGAFVSTS